MAIKVKSKKPHRGAGHSRKKKASRHSKKTQAHASPAESKHAPVSKSLLVRKPAHKAHSKKPLVRKASHSQPMKSVLAHGPRDPREFAVAAEPASARHVAGKKKKKKQMVLRFTENTLRDIAALECVRRCFR